MRTDDYGLGISGHSAEAKAAAVELFRSSAQRQAAIAREVATAMRALSTARTPRRTQQAVAVILARAPEMLDANAASTYLLDVAVFVGHQYGGDDREAALVWQTVFDHVHNRVVREAELQRGLCFAPEGSVLREKVEAAYCDLVKTMPPPDAYAALKELGRSGQVDDSRFLPLLIQSAGNYTPFQVQKLVETWAKAASLRQDETVTGEGFTLLCNHIHWLDQIMGNHVRDLAAGRAHAARPSYRADDFGACTVAPWRPLMADGPH